MNTKHRFISVLMILAMVTTLVVVAAAPASAAMVTGTISVGNSPSWGGTAATYTIGFTTTVAVPANGSVTVLFPAGTTVPTSIDKSYVSLVGATPGANPFVFATGIPAHPTGVTVSHTAGFAVGAHTLIITASAGIKNPATPGATYTAMVYTSAEDGPAGVASGVYSVTTGIAVSPVTGPAGTPITVIGGGFAANTSVDIVGVGGAVVGSTTASATGTIDATITASAGTNGAVIGARDGAGTSAAPLQTFTLLPSATATPTSGLVTTKITLQGQDFTAGAITGVTFGGTALTPVASEAALVASSYTIINDLSAAPTTKCTVKLIPPAAATAGAKKITVTNAAGSGSATFDVTGAAVTLSPAAGAAGSSVVLNGTGFAASQTAGGSVVFTDALSVATTVVATITTGADGSVAATFQVPGNAAAGTARVVATDRAGRSATGYFSVSPASITITPAAGAAGTTVTIVGTGYPAYSGLALTIGTANVSPIPTVLTDSAGNFTTTFVVPSLGAGAQVITATAGGVAPTAIYTIASASVPMTSGLATVSDIVTKVWSFDGATQSWQLYDTAAGATSTLTSFITGNGYWIESSAAGSLVYGGTSHPIYAGWTLIGW